jgi:hypothetical protein
MNKKILTFLKIPRVISGNQIPQPKILFTEPVIFKIPKEFASEFILYILGKNPNYNIKLNYPKKLNEK